MIPSFCLSIKDKSSVKFKQVKVPLHTLHKLLNFENVTVITIPE